MQQPRDMETLPLYPNTIGWCIKRQGYTYEEVADEIGVTRRTLSNYIKGRRATPRPLLEKIARVIDCEVQELAASPAHQSRVHPSSILVGKQSESNVFPLLGRTHDAGATLHTSEPPIVVHSDLWPALPGMPTVLIRTYQAVDRVIETAEGTPKEQEGALLASEANHLVYLLAEGWSVEAVFNALHIILKVVQAMPESIREKISRRQVLQLGIAAAVSGIRIPTGEHVSFEEQARLHNTMGESIAATWKLFHTAGNAQVLAVSQAQLYLVQQCHSVLSPRHRNVFYSSVYNLIGRALYFQEHYQEALDAHINAHIAAMGTGNPWDVVQSLICQVDSRQALGRHAEAIETIEEALRFIGNPTDEAYLRSKAHLFACWADNAMTIGEHMTAQKKLEASAAYLDQISPNEEFDRAHWHQFAGKYAFITGDYETATEHFKKALAELPPSWIVRQVLILMPMMAAYTWQRDREASFATADRAVTAISILNASTINKLFNESLRGLLGAFPNDPQVHRFVADKLHQLPYVAAVVE